MTVIPHRTAHLQQMETDCDPQAKSKAGQLAYLLKIAEWIAILHDRRHTIRELCKMQWGTDSEGRIYNPDPKVLGEYETYMIIIKRLESYYNWKIGQLSPYKIEVKQSNKLKSLGLPGVADNILDWVKSVVQTMRDTPLRNDAIIPYIQQKTGWTSKEAFTWLDHLIETRQIK